MSMLVRSLSGVLMGAALLSSYAGAQDGASARIDGKWFTYPGIVEQGAEYVEGPEPIPEPPLKPQYLAEWKAERQRIADATANGTPLPNNYTYCLPDGMPAMMQAMFPMEVLESPGQVTIIEEAFNQVRRVYLDEKQIEIEDAEPKFWGHSVGYWAEDGSLIVDTIGIKENVQFRNVPHSNQMRISEKIVLVSDDMMENHVTVTDAEYLTGPWSWTWAYSRESDYKLFEYVCEDNRHSSSDGVQTLRLFGE